MSTYCGKDCGACSYREELDCPGCKLGPGRMISGDCKLARCCRDKGHENCETCSNKRNCGIWLDKGIIAKQRIETKKENEKTKKERVVTAQALVKWVNILFWMVIPMELFSLLGHEKIITFFPFLELPVKVALVLMQLVCVWVLFQMSKTKDVYKKPAIFVGLVTLLEVISLLLPNNNQWMPIFGVTSFAFSLIACYQEYMAHSEVVTPFNWELGEGWKKIWKWTLWGMTGMFASVFITIISAFFGVLVLIVCAVLMIAASVLKYVYLYRMAQIFKSCSTE